MQPDAAGQNMNVSYNYQENNANESAPLSYEDMGKAAGAIIPEAGQLGPIRQEMTSANASGEIKGLTRLQTLS